MVVGVDGSDSALRAVRWAADEAARRRRRCGWSPPSAGPTTSSSAIPACAPATATSCSTSPAGRWPQAAVDGPRSGRPALEITDELRIGYPIGTLADEARRAQLLVVGDRGLTRVEGLLLGSVGVALAAHAACPVVVVRGPEPAGPTLPVVVGVEASPVSEAAIAFAFQAAADRSVPSDRRAHLVGHLPRPRPVHPAVRRRRTRSTSRSAGASGWPDGRRSTRRSAVTRLVTRDRPAHLLLEQSRQAQLVVVGSRGHGEFAGLVLGSVSNALVHKAGCPVAIVRPKPRRRPERGPSDRCSRRSATP